MVGGPRLPGPVLVALVHGELLTGLPFAQLNGVVARAAARVASVQCGLDVHALGVPEVSFFRRPAGYREVAAGYAAGSVDGVREWLLYHCRAIEAGAREGWSIADAAGGSPSRR